MNAIIPPATQLPAAPPVPPRFPFLLLLLIWFAVVLAGTVVTFILPESFVSSARIKLECDKSDLEELNGKGGFNPYDPYFIQTEFEVMQSELILARVIEELDLNTEWGKRYNGGQKLRTQESLTLLRGRLMLRPVRSTTLIDIRVYSADPAEAAKLANTIAGTYKQFRWDQAQQLAREERKSLEAALKKLDERIRSTQEELASDAQPAENPRLPDADKLTRLKEQNDLEELNNMRQLLLRRMTAADLDLTLPRSAQVNIIETARPGLKPVRPNKPLNIILSVLMGALVSLLLATLVYLLQLRSFRRMSGADRPSVL